MSRGPGGRRPAGKLESEVLAALWAATEPLTPRDVQDELGGDLAYTTVMTTLARLCEKGAVSRRRVGRAYAYAPMLDRAETAAAKMRELLDAGEDREVVLARFVGSLSDADERLLAEALREARDGEGQEQ
jgi:predicted transcriptional regulator